MVKIENFKPLSNFMIEVLMDCHERELLKLEPFEAGSIKHAKGLIVRGLLNTKSHTRENGKTIVAVYVTDLGSQCLSRL